MLLNSEDNCAVLSFSNILVMSVSIGAMGPSLGLCGGFSEKVTMGFLIYKSSFCM